MRTPPLIETVVLSAVIASIVSTLHYDIATARGRPARPGPLNTLDEEYRHRVTEAAAIALGRLSQEIDTVATPERPQLRVACGHCH